MRQTVSLGALTLLLSGSAMLPGLAESGRAASLPPGQAAADTLDLSIRQVELSSPAEATQPVMPPVQIAPEPASQTRVVATRLGQASWYGPGLYGRRTASGEPLERGALTAAHPNLPFGTKVRVTNLWNGRSQVVRINDRGPFHAGRVIDLSQGAADRLGLTASGVAHVKLEVLDKP